MQVIIRHYRTLLIITLIWTFMSALLIIFPIGKTLSADQDTWEPRGEYGYVLRFHQFRNAKGELPIFFPGYNASPHRPQKSTLALSHCGHALGPQHDSSINIHDHIGGGYNHRQGYVIFAVPDKTCQDPLILQWRYIQKPPAVIIFVLSILILLGLLLINENPPMTKFTISCYTALKKAGRRNISLLITFGILVFYFLISIMNFPDLISISLDSRHWVQNSQIISPYFGILANLFQSLIPTSLGNTTLGYQVFVLFAFYAGLSYFAFCLIYYSKHYVVAPIITLLVCGSDSITIYNFQLLSESTAFGVIFACLGSFIAAHVTKNWKHWLSVAILCAFGFALRGALVFLIPLFFTMLLLGRPKIIVVILSGASLLSAIFTFHVLIPQLMGREAPSQIGLMMISQTYHLGDGKTNLQSESKELIEHLANYKTQRTSKKNYHDTFSFDSKNLASISRAGKKWAYKKQSEQSTNEDFLEMNEKLLEISLDNIRQHPLQYFSHSIKHALYAPIFYENLYRHDWYGQAFYKNQTAKLRAVELFAKELKRSDILANFQSMDPKGIQKKTPLGFDLTKVLISKNIYLLSYFMLLFYGFVIYFICIIRGCSDKNFVTLMVSISGIGYLLTSSMVTPIIVRYAVVSEAFILIFLPLMLSSIAIKLYSYRVDFVSKSKLLITKSSSKSA